MGITKELTRSVFSKSRSFGTHDQNNHNHKKRFRAVRSYLCGDKLINSVVAEEDSASIKSLEFTISHPISDSFGTTTVNIEPETENSEITVAQPVKAVFDDENEIQSNENSKMENRNSTATFFCQENAALIIQSAFRGFLRRRNEELKSMESKNKVLSEIASPTRDSVGTSVEVQTGNSTKIFSTRAEIMAVHNRMKHKARARALKLKEDWDDSTVSSNIIKLRMQNRLEATTRRERALAYAFSQQLRICSKKKPNRSDETEINMGWSWLERWMATRSKENECFDSNKINQIEPDSINQRSSSMRKRFFDLPGEEMESCGSNEVSAQMVSDSFSTTKEKYNTKTTKNRLKATRIVSKRKTVPSSPYPGGFSKSGKKECPKEEGRKKGKEVANNEKRECNISAVP